VALIGDKSFLFDFSDSHVARLVLFSLTIFSHTNITGRWNKADRDAASHFIPESRYYRRASQQASRITPSAPSYRIPTYLPRMHPKSAFLLDPSEMSQHDLLGCILSTDAAAPVTFVKYRNKKLLLTYCAMRLERVILGLPYFLVLIR
jgi:hypothetical protein